MSTFPAAAEDQPTPWLPERRISACPGLRHWRLLVAVLGLSTIWSTVNALWALWTTDALKSIGMFIPLVSFVLILRVWRSLGWEMDGQLVGPGHPGGHCCCGACA